jgi:tetrahydromethanopterin S-methyltransferase subunit G
MIKTNTKTETLSAVELYNKLDIPYILTSISVSNGAKFPKWINPKNPPADYPKVLKDIAYHLWTREQIKSFNKWVVKHHKKDITDFIGIPNLANYVVIDIDSKEEVEKLKHTGIVDKIHTKSIRKRLPHILVKVKDVDFMVKDVSKILGKSKGRDIDMITNVIYEKIDGEVYGEDIAEMTLNEIGENIFGDKKLIIMRQGIISQRSIGNSKKKN